MTPSNPGEISMARYGAAVHGFIAGEIDRNEFAVQLSKLGYLPREISIEIEDAAVHGGGLAVESLPPIASMPAHQSQSCGCEPARRANEAMTTIECLPGDNKDSGQTSFATQLPNAGTRRETAAPISSGLPMNATQVCVAAAGDGGDTIATNPTRHEQRSGHHAA